MACVDDDVRDRNWLGISNYVGPAQYAALKKNIQILASGGNPGHPVRLSRKALYWVCLSNWALFYNQRGQNEKANRLYSVLHSSDHDAATVLDPASSSSQAGPARRAQGRPQPLQRGASPPRPAGKPHGRSTSPPHLLDKPQPTPPPNSRGSQPWWPGKKWCAPSTPLKRAERGFPIENQSSYMVLLLATARSLIASQSCGWIQSWQGSLPHNHALLSRNTWHVRS
jgi:hypothetical protein